MRPTLTRDHDPVYPSIRIKVTYTYNVDTRLTNWIVGLDGVKGIRVFSLELLPYMDYSNETPCLFYFVHFLYLVTDNTLFIFIILFLVTM